jgi:Tfp pilus assembly protein PilN
MFAPGDQDAEAFAQQTADIIAQEIEITWRRLFGNDPDAGLRVFLIAPPPMAAALAPALQDKTNGPVVPVNPYARVTRSAGVEADLPLCIAEGLALRALGPQGADRLDFLAAYQARLRPGLRITKELTVCAALAAAAAVVWTAGLFLQRSSLESNYGQGKKQAEAIFRQAVPEETNLVDPAAQLQQRLEAFRQECEILTGLQPGRSAPLEILYALSGNLPATGSLQLQEVLIAGDSVRITGSCDSFATLSQWQRLLETIPGWKVVDVPSPKKDAPSGQVQFTISLSAGEGQA